MLKTILNWFLNLFPDFEDDHIIYDESDELTL